MQSTNFFVCLAAAIALGIAGGAAIKNVTQFVWVTFLGNIRYPFRHWARQIAKPALDRYRYLEPPYCGRKPETRGQ